MTNSLMTNSLITNSTVASIPGFAHPGSSAITLDLGKELGDHIVASFDLRPGVERCTKHPR
jgi:hypothetical protein